MRLPKDILNAGLYTKPNFYLCETDKEKICKLETTNASGSFKFNSLSEISFDVARVYNDLITGETKVNPYYSKIEALRLIEIEGFGYFELQGPELVSNGIEEKKSCKAYSLEYTLAQKYLEDFYVNMGTVESLEVINASSENNIVPITLYNKNNPKLSLLHLVLNEIYGWKIGHVDASLQTLSRQFEVDRESVYDFLMNEICEKFNCYIVFDTINNTINIYAESLTAKFIGDGKTNKFIISPPFLQIGTVSVDGYKTTKWEYQASTGTLILEDTPEFGAHIEVVDGALTEWETDVFVSFDNLAQEVNINYDSDSIKTKLTVTYGDDYDIREVNLGLPYLTDISYYYTVDWMGQDLYDAYTKYMQKSNDSQAEYTQNSQEILKWNDRISYEENRLSLEYSLVESVNSSTVGTYYIRKQNADGSYYYSEVSLPSEYIVDMDYYSNLTTNVNEEKVSNLYDSLKKYFYAYFNNEEDGKTDALKELSELLGFEFIEGYTLIELHNDLKSETELTKIDNAILRFLQELWPDLGRTPLKTLYLEPYKKRQQTNIEAGWSNKNNKNYGQYYPVTLFINSIESAIAQRDETIKNYKEEQSKFQFANAEIGNSLLMRNNFTEAQLIRLSAFLREDELHIDDIVETGLEDLSSSFKIKQDAVESGRIELQRISQPQLQFSMTMANIYALPEFEPIIHQFQLGKVIRVGLRHDYVKQSRLLQVDIKFDNFSDFSCEFGELTSLRTQSDIHADLLSNAITAGKSVATNSSYWTRGSDQATSLDLKIQQGLLDSTTQIKAIDGNQGVVIDKYGIKLQKKLENGEIDPKQTWLVNNVILMSDDGFKTSRSALGEITVDGETYYGLIAEMVLSGYIEGSIMKGGTIQIGKRDDGTWSFEVDKDGNVSMCGGTVQFSTEKNSIEELEESIPTKTSQLENDSGYENATGIVSIIDGTVNADYVNALEINVKAANITGKLIADQIDATNLKAGSVDAENITGTTITGKSIVGGDLSIGDKENTYAEITSDGVLNCAGANISGNINATSGNIGDCSISDGKLQIKAANIADLLTADKIDVTNLKVDAANIVSGVIDTARIPNLSADKITSGTINADRIDVSNIKINAANITSGTIDVARIPDLSADKITSGTISANRIDVANIKIDAANITSGTIDSARISSLSADKITAGAIKGSSSSGSAVKIGSWRVGDSSLWYSSGSGSRKKEFFLSGEGRSGFSVNGNSYNPFVIYANGNFGVDNTGKLYATGADISGKITATGGKIGGWNVGTVTFKYNGSTIGTATGLYSDEGKNADLPTRVALTPTKLVIQDGATLHEFAWYAVANKLK